jgi:hypothetical protein
VVFLCKSVISLLDVGGRGILVDSEGSIRVGYRSGGCGCVELLVGILAYSFTTHGMSEPQTLIIGVFCCLFTVSDGLLD